MHSGITFNMGPGSIGQVVTLCSHCVHIVLLSNLTSHNRPGESVRRCSPVTAVGGATPRPRGDGTQRDPTPPHMSLRSNPVSVSP